MVADPVRELRLRQLSRRQPHHHVNDLVLFGLVARLLPRLSGPLEELDGAQVGGALVAAGQRMVAHQVRTEDGGLLREVLIKLLVREGGCRSGKCGLA